MQRSYLSKVQFLDVICYVSLKTPWKETIVLQLVLKASTSIILGKRGGGETCSVKVLALENLYVIFQCSLYNPANNCDDSDKRYYYYY